MSYLFEQLPLAVQLRDDATFDNFYSGNNTLLLDTLRKQLMGGERYVYLYGKKGSGRSHLLQAACHQVDESGQSAIYLPLAELKEYPPEELFEGLEHQSLVCLDDIDAVVSSDIWQQQLFHLFNRLSDTHIPLLISGRCAVRELDIELQDLASRLSWGAVFQLQNLTDDQRIATIKLRAERRGLLISDEVAHYIYNRCRRDTQFLLSVLDTLDAASLKHQRRLTVPFVKETMGW
jgi:DnaA family protein